MAERKHPGEAASELEQLRLRLEEVTEERDLLRVAVDGSSDLVVIAGDDGRPRFVNRAARDVMGYEPEELLEIDPIELIHPDDRDAIAQRIAAVRSEDEVHGPAVVRIRHRDGTWRWIEVLATNLLDDPTVRAIVTTSRDITGRIDDEQRIRAESERHRALIETVPDPVVRFTRELYVHYINPAAEEVLADRDGRGQLHWPEASLVRSTEQLHAVIRERKARRFENRVERGGRTVWYEVAAVPEIGPDGEVEGITTISREITERKRTERELTRRALEDPLTGLANRMRFEEELSEALAEPADEELVAVLYLDLDRFKEINDTRGHHGGDEHLRQVGDRLRRAARQDDLVARIGGDEFGVRPLGVTGREEAIALARRIHEALEDLTMELPDGGVAGSTSIGVAFAVPGGETVDDLLRRADQAMYRAKREGRGRTVAAD